MVKFQSSTLVKHASHKCGYSTVHGVAKSVLYRWAACVVKRARDREAGCVSADWHVVKAMADCLRHNAHPASIQNLSVVSTTKVLSPFVCFYVSDGIINKSNKTHSPWQRSEVLDLWYQLCECAQMHKAQAQELELAKQVKYLDFLVQPKERVRRFIASMQLQEIDTLAAIEARFEELQLEARWSDRVGSALGDMVQYLRSKADHSLQSTASKSVSLFV